MDIIITMVVLRHIALIQSKMYFPNCALSKVVGHLPLQPRLHPVGKRVEVVHGERVLVGRHSSVQAHHVWPAARDPQRQVDVGQRVHALEKLCELRVQAGIQDGPS